MKIDKYRAQEHRLSFRFRGLTFAVFSGCVNWHVYRLRKGGIRGERSQYVHDFWKAGYDLRDLYGQDTDEDLLRKAKETGKLWYVFEEGRAVGCANPDEY